MYRVAEEDQHILFEVHLPVSAKSVEYLFVLDPVKGGRRCVGQPGGAGQSFRAPLKDLRPRAPVWWRDAVLYTLFVDRFRRGGGDGAWSAPNGIDPEDLLSGASAGGDLAGITEALPYLRDLGVTVLHLTPIALSPSAHRYDCVDPRATDPRLGGHDALVILLDAAHAHGLRVILDVTVTHVHRRFFAFRDVCRRGRRSPYWNWFFIRRYPFRSGINPGYAHYQKKQWEEPLLRTHLPAVADYLVGTFEHWARLGADGFRIDATAGVPIELTQRITEAVEAIRPDTLVFGEVIPDNTHRWTAGAIHAATDFVAQQTLYHWIWRRRMSAHEVAKACARRRFWRGGPGWTAIHFTATHDQHRLRTLTQSPEATRLAHLMVLMRAGIPAIYYGDEIGLSSGPSLRPFEDAWPDRQCMPWDRAQWDTETLTLFREAIRLRRAHPALSRGDERCLSGRADPVLTVRRTGGAQIIDILLHNGAERCTVPLPTDAPSGARPLLVHGDATVNADESTVTLGPWAGVVLAREPARPITEMWDQIVARNRELCALSFRDGHVELPALPCHLYLTVTERCNLRCRHCITHAPRRTTEGRAREMQPWLIERLMPAFAAADYFGFSHGGESLVASIFPEVLQAIQRARVGRDKGYDVHLLTNGMRLTPETLKRLIELGVTSLAISLDGASAATNDSLRQGCRLDTVVSHLRDAVSPRSASSGPATAISWGWRVRFGSRRHRWSIGARRRRHRSGRISRSLRPAHGLDGRRVAAKYRCWQEVLRRRPPHRQAPRRASGRHRTAPRP